MRLTKYLFTFCFLFCLAGSGLTQIGTSIAETYSLQEGLSDRSVRSIIKGRDSLMWIGTANGLNKFDGYNFTVFNSDPDDSLRLLSSNIQSIHQDTRDQLLIFYENITWMFNIFDPLNYELRKVEISPLTGVKGIVRAIEVDEQGDMFVLTFNESEDSTRLYQFNGQNNFLPVFSLYQPHRVEQNYQAVLRHLSNGDFLINDSAIGLQLLDAEGNIKKYFQANDFRSPEDQSAIPYPNRINILHEDRFGQVWVAWENTPGIFDLQYDDFKFKRKKGFDQSGLYTAIWEDQPGNLLIQQSSPAGMMPEVKNVFAYTPIGQILNFSHLLDDPKIITCLFSEDFFKTIFLGTKDGFKVVRNNRFRIKTYLNQESQEVNNNIVLKGITGDDDYVYLAAESQHWYRLDLATDLLDTLTFWDATGRQLDMECGVNLVKDADGFIWGAACESRLNSKLYKYDPDQCTVEDFDIPYPIRAFTIAENGSFWLGCSPSESNGILLSFNPNTGTYNEFYLQDSYNPLQTSIPNYVFQSRDGLIWVGTGNGVYTFNPTNQHFVRYHTDADSPERRISHNSCLLIYEDEAGNIMLGTQNGLNIIDRESGQIKVLRRRDGLSNNTVTGILPDGTGNFWISTNNGISFYDPSDDTFKNFFQADGFSANAFNPFSFYRDEKGRYYFGSVNGLNVFLPKDLLLHEPKPTVLLTKIERYRSRDDSLMVMESNLHQIDQLVIEPYDTYFALHFTFPEFSRPGKNQYRMKLGNSQTWSNLYNDPIIRFHKFPAGNYTLLVEGADANGNWSAKPFVLPIKVKKPFYEKTWVLVLFILIIFSLIYWVFQSRMRQRLRMEQLRTKLASDLHDEVSGLLSGIAMQSDLVQFMVTDSRIQTRLKTIGEVSRKAMSKMSDVIWSIDSRKDQLEDLIGRMHEHADEMLLPLNIRYDIQISHKLDRSQKIPANIRQDLYFIYKEAINNIAKHSNANRVFINMRQSGNYFELSVQDNGTPVQQLAPAHAHENMGDQSGTAKSIGAAAQSIKKKGGQGLSNLKMRAERLKADLNINRKDGYAILLRMKKFM
ncbi:ligand-binding sensor domain-containing protein [Flavilitoribacter nigricans]|uniref:Two component regulator three Y domain-containing protein n=1 Tax=Flavilitoribacter nigricans (strain ATCC 23147 / DSM 23189 / NBRC 102662 / NCIMB 1420 / SS-2) TaxID=1122177 RepID=A0A2D0NDB0_FLAN2|nr:sensor histidine kinase [Flavilitoribacter nigricans]PHN06465.1 hypothetical protein CRP01_12925 [Flavilitoribacter nigricans DSM 23189 = NBRC 102662]